MKWGLLGGTFDPVHVGHLRCAEEVREMFALDLVLFVPASRPPHKEGAPVAPFHHRARMLGLAVSGNDFFSLSEMENDREGKSFSVDTVELLLAGQPGIDLYFIVGHDAFRLIQTWKEWERLLSLCNFIVMTRPGCREEALAEILPPAFADLFVYDRSRQGYRGPEGRAIYFRRVSYLDVSSSHIRERIRKGKSIRYLVPDAVFSYIEEQGCYGSTGRGK